MGDNGRGLSLEDSMVVVKVLIFFVGGGFDQFAKGVVEERLGGLEVVFVSEEMLDTVGRGYLAGGFKVAPGRMGAEEEDGVDSEQEW